MKRYEYIEKLVCYDALKHILNDMGKEGWQVVMDLGEGEVRGWKAKNILFMREVEE